MPIYSGSPENVRLASQALIKGEAVALPTETVYGLAANALNVDAASKIFNIKGRPLIDPLIVHIYDWTQTDLLAHMPPAAKQLAEHFWPGPLTLVVPKKEIVPDIITAGKNTVAIRIPKHPLFRAVLKETNLPLAAPSANPFGYLSPTQAFHVEASLGSKVSIILDGGACDEGIESTILDVSGDHLTILRPGPISQTQIEAIVNQKVTIKHSFASIEENQSAPGMLKQHYSPHTPLFLFEDLPPPLTFFAEKKIAIVYLKRPIELNPKSKAVEFFWLSENGDLREVARNLFTLLQSLDNSKWSAIYMQKAPQSDIGISINDRLSRSAAKFSNT